MKRPLLFAIALALTLGLAGGSAFAGGGKGLKNAGKQRGAGPRFERLHEILDKMDLNADQHKSIDQILTDAEAKLLDLRAQAKSSGDKQAVRGQVRTIMQDTIQKVSAQLTPEQKQQFRAQVQEQRKQARGKNDGGGDKSNPPTSQPQA
jgi:hypothetical protein